MPDICGIDVADLAPREGENPTPIMPTVPFQTCPIRASLGTLGRRWSLVVLRDVGFFGPVRFSTMLRHNPGLGPRVLSLRLKELRDDGLIERAGDETNDAVVYSLTPKGHDIMPILLAFIEYGSKHHADEVFADGMPRTVSELFPTLARPAPLTRRSAATVAPVRKRSAAPAKAR